MIGCCVHRPFVSNDLWSMANDNKSLAKRVSITRFMGRSIRPIGSSSKTNHRFIVYETIIRPVSRMGTTADSGKRFVGCYVPVSLSTDQTLTTMKPSSGSKVRHKMSQNLILFLSCSTFN